MKRSHFAAGSAGLSILGAVGLPAAAADINVTVDGQQVGFSPPPISRAGRVFVPLRGVFERLGATVVYQGGVINATGRNGQTVSLQIGSTQATINGQQQGVDVAPFIIGASTYVPLRFVAQALGATVNYDGANSIVAITTAGGGQGPQRPPEPPPEPARSGLQLSRVSPERGGVVGSTKPDIEAAFSQPVDPNSVRVFLDDRDVTEFASVSESGFVYAPPSPLQSIQHTVRVVGVDRSGARFERRWQFTSGTAQPRNFVEIRSPRDGEPVGANFDVRGRTLPGARVRITAGGVGNVGPFAFNTGNYTGDTIADGDGMFSQTVTLQGVPGASIGVSVVSVDPRTRESAERRLRLVAR